MNTVNYTKELSVDPLEDIFKRVVMEDPKDLATLRL